MKSFRKLSNDEVELFLSSFDNKSNDQTEHSSAHLYEMSDNNLLIAYVKGTNQAARILVDRLMPKIRSHAYYRLGNIDDAEDVTQETFLKLWKIAPSWKKDNAKVSTWLYRVVINLCHDKHRRKTLYSLDTVPDIVDNSHSSIDKLADKSRQIALYSAMSELPARQRLAVQLRHIDELKNTDIAEIMDLSVEAVESLIARGKRKLIEILEIHKSELGYRYE